MQMNDPIIMQILNTQTQMLQQMQNLQGQQLQGISTTGAQMSGRPAPVGMTGATMFDPSMYGAPVMAPDVGMDHSLQRTFVSANAGIAAQLFNNYVNYNPMRQSREAQADFLARQNRVMQEGLLNTAQTVGQIGSFFTPGGIVLGTAAGFAVGGTIKTMANEARQAMDYEDILRRKSYTFLNPFESTSELGGIGFSRPENQDLAKFLRHLGPEKFMDDQDIKEILNGSMDHKLMRSVTDVDSFKKKFSEIVDAVKHITVTMDQSIDEAMKFMGELNARGIGTNQMGLVAAQTKVASSMLGMSASAGAQLMMQTSDAVTQGTAINSGVAAQTASNNLAISSLVFDWSKENNKSLYDFMINNGGAAQMGSTSEQMIRQFIGQAGSQELLGLFGGGFRVTGSGGFEVDNAKMAQLLSGRLSTQDLIQSSHGFTSQLTAAQRDELVRQAPTLFQNFAQGPNEFRLLGALVNQLRAKSPGLSAAQILERELHLQGNPHMADLLAQQINMGTDPNVQSSLQGQNVRQELDSIGISESPSFFERMRAGFSGAVTKRIGDIGQNASDSVSDMLMNVQKSLAGIEDRQFTGGRVYDFNAEKMSHELGLSRTLGAAGMSDAEKKAIDVITPGRFDVLIDRAKSGSLDAASVAQLQELVKSGKLNNLDNLRLMHVINQAEGNYNGPVNRAIGNLIGLGPDFSLTGSLDSLAIHSLGLLDRTETAFMNKTKTALSPFMKLLGMAPTVTDSEITMKSFEDKEKDFSTGVKRADQDLARLFAKGSGELGTDRYQELQNAIRSGDVDAVRALTSNDEARTLAEKYRSMVADEKNTSGKLSDFNKQVEYSEALARSVGKTQEIFAQAGIMTKGGAAAYFGSLNDTANDFLDKLKSGKFSKADMVSNDNKIYYGLQQSFVGTTEEQRLGIVNTLIRDSGNTLTQKDFTGKNGQIDIDKLTMHMMELLAKTQSEGVTDAVKKGANGVFGKQTDQALADHSKAMYNVLTTMQGEVDMMKDFQNGRKIQPPKINVSTGSGR